MKEQMNSEREQMHRTAEDDSIGQCDETPTVRGERSERPGGAGDELPIVPPYARESMTHGYRPRYHALNESQRRAFHAMVEQAFGAVAIAEIPDVSDDDTYIAWCALRRDFPEVFWVKSARITPTSHGSLIAFVFDEPVAHGRRSVVLFEFALRMVMVTCALFTVVQSMGADAPQEMDGELDEETSVRSLYRHVVRAPLLHDDVPDICSSEPHARAYVLAEQAALDLKCLCDRCGIDCQVVMGMWRGYPHAWNVVRVRGRWLHVDVYAGREGPKVSEAAGGVSEEDVMRYLMRSNDEMHALQHDWHLGGLLPYL